jgi:hypothetical protein
VADLRTCFADELAGYQLGMTIGFQFTSVLGNKVRFEQVLAEVTHSSATPGKVHLVLVDREVEYGRLALTVDADTIVDVTPAPPPREDDT